MSRASLLLETKPNPNSPALDWDYLESQFTPAQTLPQQQAELGRISLSADGDLAEQPRHAPESATQQKSFNVLASVTMMRADIDRYGRVLLETRSRVQDEELSLIVEGMDKAACTKFVLQRRGNDLTYYKNGEWHSYTAMLLTGRQVAIDEAKANPRKRFLADEAVRDYHYGLKMRALKPGEQLAWFSSYPFHIEQQYGKAFVQSCGRFPDRQMGFIYQAISDEAGNVVLESQTVDHSNLQGFMAAMAYAKQHPKAATAELRDAYDTELQKQEGGVFNAGRREVKRNEDAWATLLNQRDIIEYMHHKLESFAYNPSLHGEALELAVREHMYGVWAACKQRLDNPQEQYITYDDSPKVRAAQMSLVAAEVNGAFIDFANRGMVMVGCGGEISTHRGKDEILKLDPIAVHEALFGGATIEKVENATGHDRYGSLTFQCPRNHVNRRPRNQLISSCQHKGCKAKVSC